MLTLILLLPDGKSYTKQISSYRKELCTHHPANIYLFKFSNISNRKSCEICPKLVKSPETRQWRSSGLRIVDFEHTSHLFLVFLSFTFYWANFSHFYSDFSVLYYSAVVVLIHLYFGWKEFKIYKSYLAYLLILFNISIFHLKLSMFVMLTLQVMS